VEGWYVLAVYLATTRQHEAAGEALRNALLVCEGAWHPGFRPWEVACCLPWAPPPSLPATMYTVLAAAARRAGRAAAHGAAFNTMKLVAGLSMNGTGGCSVPLAVCDPLRLLPVLDYYALRAGDAAWVVAMTGPQVAGGAGRAGAGGSGAGPLVPVGASGVPLVWLPGWAWSRSLALFTCERTGATLHTDAPRPPRMPVPPAATAAAMSPSALLAAAIGDMEYACYSASRLAVRTLAAFPGSLLPLLAALGVSADSVGADGVLDGVTDLPPGAHPACRALPACVWRRVWTDPLYAAPYEEWVACAAGTLAPAASRHWAAPGLYQLTRIFVSRHADLYRRADVLGWIYTVARVTAAIAGGALPAGGGGSSEPGDEAADDADVIAALVAAWWGSAETASAEVATAALVRRALYGDLYDIVLGGAPAAMAGWAASMAHYDAAVLSGMCEGAGWVTQVSLLLHHSHILPLTPQPQTTLTSWRRLGSTSWTPWTAQRAAAAAAAALAMKLLTVALAATRVGTRCTHGGVCGRWNFVTRLCGALSCNPSCHGTRCRTRRTSEQCWQSRFNSRHYQ